VLPRPIHYSSSDPKHTHRPFLHAKYDWEMHGFTSPAVVANGLVHFRREWLLYYGAADRRIGLAVCRPRE